MGAGRGRERAVAARHTSAWPPRRSQTASLSPVQPAMRRTVTGRTQRSKQMAHLSVSSSSMLLPSSASDLAALPLSSGGAGQGGGGAAAGSEARVHRAAGAAERSSGATRLPTLHPATAARCCAAPAAPPSPSPPAPGLSCLAALSSPAGACHLPDMIAWHWRAFSSPLRLASLWIAMMRWRISCWSIARGWGAGRRQASASARGFQLIGREKGGGRAQAPP